VAKRIKLRSRAGQLLCDIASPERDQNLKKRRNKKKQQVLASKHNTRMICS